jgi:hypothetical protein
VRSGFRSCSSIREKVLTNRPPWFSCGLCAPKAIRFLRDLRAVWRTGALLQSRGSYRRGWEPLCWHPRHLRQPPEERRLVDWTNLTDAKKVHSDKVYKRKNLETAWEKVKENRGSGGVDGQTLGGFEAQLNQTAAGAERGHLPASGWATHENSIVSLPPRVLVRVSIDGPSR